MKLTRLTAAAAAALVLPAALAGSAAASSATTTHGEFSSVVYTNCSGSTWTEPAAGRWNVSIRNATVATATFNIFVNGVHHVAFGLPGLAVSTTPNGWTFAFPTGAGRLVVSYDSSTLTYAFPDGYSLGGLTCQSVTYLGS